MYRDTCPYCNKHVNINDEDTAIIYNGRGMFRTKILIHGRCYLISIKEVNDARKKTCSNDQKND